MISRNFMVINTIKNIENINKTGLFSFRTTDERNNFLIFYSRGMFAGD